MNLHTLVASWVRQNHTEPNGAWGFQRHSRAHRLPLRNQRLQRLRYTPYVFAVALVLQGCVSSRVEFHQQLSRAEVDGMTQQNIPLALRVVPPSAESVQSGYTVPLSSSAIDRIQRDNVKQATEVLKKTGLFASVTDDPSVERDLDVIAVAASEGEPCATPRALSLITLGLVRQRSPYQHVYRLRFANPSAPETILFSRTYGGTSIVGAFVRERSDRPATRIQDLLRKDLLAIKSQLRDLARATE